MMNGKRVQITETRQGWQLLVDDVPFTIKGVGCEIPAGENGEDYLLMARRMGANAVRRWSIPARSYLDRAHRHGLMVDAGVGLGPIRATGRESYVDAAYCRHLKNNILSFIKKMKDHPAILSWNLGNEVFAFTESTEERQAFGVFLEDLIQCVRSEDSDHPVVYASAATLDLPFLKRYAPSIDIVGMNVYESFAPGLQWLRENDFKKPVIIAEFGPRGAWSVKKDANGMPQDEMDQIKAGHYVALWKEIEKNRSTCFGGFAFVMGRFRNQDSLTWFNMNFREFKREAYWALYQMYTGFPAPRFRPRIERFTLSRVNGLRANEPIEITIESGASKNGNLHYDYFITNILSDPVIVEPPRYYPSKVKRISPGVARLKVPGEPGMYRVYGLVTQRGKNAAVANHSIRVV